MTGDISKNAHDRFRSSVEHAAHLLPAQGPITVFIHHNTLHALEGLPFEQAVVQGAEIFGCEPFLTEERYRAELETGRIRDEELRTVLLEDLGEKHENSVAGLTTRLEWRLMALRFPLWSAPAAELEYFISESDALRKIRSDVPAPTRRKLLSETRRWLMREVRGRSDKPVWTQEIIASFGDASPETWSEDEWESFTLESLSHLCRLAAERLPPRRETERRLVRHRDSLVRAGGDDPDRKVHEILARFCAAFLDQGIASHPLPFRDEGFYKAFLQLHAISYGNDSAPLRAVRKEAVRLLEERITPTDSALESLQILGVSDQEFDQYLEETTSALRGWAGMVHQVEIRGDRVRLPIPKGSLEEFVAIRLLLDRIFAAEAAERMGISETLDKLRDVLSQRLTPKPPLSATERSFPLFQLVQLFGWSPGTLAQLREAEWNQLYEELEAFEGLERRRFFHRAYEMRFRNQTLDALSLHPRFRAPAQRRFRFQTISCLDEREESFRRHLEEVAPDAETFGAAGFFNVAMYYRGAADAYFVPLCPVVVTPGHWVEETVIKEEHQNAEKRRKARQLVGVASHHFDRGARSFALGALLTAGVGAMATIPLALRILFPRFTAKLWERAGTYLRTPPATRLRLERTESSSEAHAGFHVDDMAERAERLLRDIGLTRDFARLVFILGHGSTSLNNPHKSAYDCGACGGSPGLPNARAVAWMLNDRRVRTRIAQNGITIPNDCWFVGAFHNTCDDSVTITDPDLIPELLREESTKAIHDLEETANRNAHERSRRFMSASLDETPIEARHHVENRSADLAQVRPELGHATNAICVVGRREWTRGLFLDRRAFLASYDPEQDDDRGTILGRLLAAAVPVCGGINLEYYFSHVDSRGYGCGTKLPHNVTALLGVMDGAASDLRTGLPWQMVEIHEPIRLLFVIETREAVLRKIMERDPVVGGMIGNGWVQVSLLDPATGEISVLRNDIFVPHRVTASSLPSVRQSADWYRGQREHLEFATIGSGAEGA